MKRLEKYKYKETKVQKIEDKKTLLAIIPSQSSDTNLKKKGM